MEKKVGRPTESKKENVIKIRVDAKMMRMLEYCEKFYCTTKSEVVRNLIEKEYIRLNSNNTNTEEK